MNTQKLLISFALILLLSVSFVASLDVDADHITIYPGDEGSVTLEVENSLDDDLADVSVRLILEGTSFTSIGGSDKTKDIDEDDKEKFTFRLKASTDIVPGDYNIPYEINYVYNEESKKETGSFGLRVSAETEIDFSVETKDAIVGNQGKISLKIVNEGLGDVKFVSVQIFPEGYELISPEKVYIGTIDSDDSDFASFDVIFKNNNPVLSAKIAYKDFDNVDQTTTVSLPVKVYTYEKALELGLVQKSNTAVYGGVVAGVLIIWFIYRKIKKSRRNNGRKN
ncbi:MAG: hypothetical protein ABIA78_00145 [archaeon]